MLGKSFKGKYNFIASPMAKSNDSKIRIFLIDAQTLFRQSVRVLIDSYPQFKVVGDAASCTNALQLITLQQPDVILLEPSYDQNCTLESIPLLIKATKQAQLLLVTHNHDIDVNRAVRMGVMGLVFKDQPAKILITAITKICDGEVWFDHATIASVLTQLSHDHESMKPEARKIATLSPREKEIISLIGQGLKTQTIADRLSLSEITIRHHLTSIYAKLGLTDRSELIVYAYRHNLAMLPE